MINAFPMIPNTGNAFIMDLYTGWTYFYFYIDVINNMAPGFKDGAYITMVYEREMDTNDDGVLDVTPWTSIVSLIALIEGYCIGGGLATALSADVRFATPDITLTSKVIDGTFPDYSRVIPQTNTRKLEVDASEFARAVDRVATVSSERSRAVKLSLDEDRLVLSDGREVDACESRPSQFKKSQAGRISLGQRVADGGTRLHALLLLSGVLRRRRRAVGE